MRKSLIFLIVSILLLGAVNAGEDFQASSQGRILGLECSNAVIPIKITNTGDITSNYLIEAIDSPEWVSFDPSFFTLAPQQAITVSEFVSYPCRTEKTYPILVSVSTDFIQKFISQDIAVQRVQNIRVTPTVYSQVIDPCGTATFKLDFTNPFSFAETYGLEVKDSVPATTLSHDELILEPGADQTVTITVQPDDCTLSGTFDPYVQIKTQNTKLVGDLDLNLAINQNDIATITPDIEIIKTDFNENAVELELSNTGNRKTSYTILLDAPEWITTETTALTLDPKKKEKIVLVFSPEADTPQDSYDVYVTALVDKTGVEYTKHYTVKLQIPTFSSKIFDEYLWNTLGIIILLLIIAISAFRYYRYINSEEYAIRKQINLAEKARVAEMRAKEDAKQKAEQEKQRKEEEKRTAKENSQREKELSAKQKDRLRRREAKMKAREKRRQDRFRLMDVAQRKHEAELRKQYTFVAKKDIKEAKRDYRKLCWKIVFWLVVLGIISLGISFRNAISSDAFWKGIIILAAIYAYYKISQQRRVSKRWALALANDTLTLRTPWKSGLGVVSVDIEEPAKHFKLTAKKARPTYAMPSATIYQSFKIESNIDAVGTAQLSFKVSESWLLKKGIAPSAIRFVRYTNNKWMPISAEVVSSDGKYVYYTAETDGIGEFAIIANKRPKPMPEWIGKAALGVLGAIALVIAVLLTVSQPNTIIKGIPVQMWQQDTTQIIDLSQYFIDPDGDTLTFTATPTQNIAVSFSDGKAYLTPEYGWSGVETAVFTAEDGKGGKVQSNRVTFVVKKAIVSHAARPILGWTLAVIMLALAIASLIVFRKQVQKFFSE